MREMLKLGALLALSALLTQDVLALGQTGCVAFKASASSFTVASKGSAAPILLSSDDWPGVQRAAVDFASDIKRVTGVQPALSNYSTKATASKASLPIIVGTLGKSSLIDQIVNATSLDVSSIEGRWESFLAQVVSNPLPGVKSAYVIIGSDKRGTIFALYDHSEQFGTSTQLFRNSQLTRLDRCIALVLVRLYSCALCLVGYQRLSAGGLMYRLPSNLGYSSLPLDVPMAHRLCSTAVSSSTMSSLLCRAGFSRSLPMEPARL